MIRKKLPKAKATPAKKAARKKAIDGKPPQKRSTDAERESRILQTMDQVIQGKSTPAIKRWFRETHGLAKSQALRDLRVARERLAAETGLSDDFTRNDMKIQHYGIAMEIVQNTDESTKDRLAALRHAGAIYGVEAARQIEARVGELPATLAPEEMRSQVFANLARFRERHITTAGENGNGKGKNSTNGKGKNGKGKNGNGNGKGTSAN